MNLTTEQRDALHVILLRHGVLKAREYLIDVRKRIADAAEAGRLDNNQSLALAEFAVRMVRP